MQKAPNHPQEEARICAVLGLNLLDTPKEERFDVITREALLRFSVPIATISILDSQREGYKSAQGISQAEGPRDISFCGHALLHDEVYIVEDTLLDPIFKDNPMVAKEKLGIRFYAGKSLHDYKTGLPVGVFCVKDYVPHKMSVTDVGDFLALAQRAEKEINATQENS